MNKYEVELPIDKAKKSVKEEEGMSGFERSILYERYFAAIRICSIIIEKWDKVFPEYEYFPTAPKVSRKWLIACMDMATEHFLDRQDLSLKREVDALWEYIDGDDGDVKTTIKRLRYSHLDIFDSIAYWLPNANMSVYNNGEMLFVDPGDGRPPMRFRTDWMQELTVDWQIGLQVLDSFKNRDHTVVK